MNLRKNHSNKMKALAEKPISKKDIKRGLLHATPFILMHVACLGTLWSGVSKAAIWVGFALFVARMWGITGGFHRYFAHKSFATSRFFQFVLAFLGGSALQQGVLWWTNHHRHHHQYSERDADVHSPVRHGFFYAHTGWIFAPVGLDRDMELVNDWKQFPELVWLDRHHYVPGVILGFTVWLLGGWSCLFFGFFCSTVLLQHATTAVNSFGHLYGTQRFITGDNSRNNWLVAFFSAGEGWHNNHHYLPRSVRHGFKWWEIDLTFYILKLLEKLGIVWNLQYPPKEVLKSDTHPPLPFGVRDRVQRLLSEQQQLDLAQIQKDIGCLAEKLSQILQEGAEGTKQKICDIMEPVSCLIHRLDEIKSKLPLMSSSFPRLNKVLSQRVKKLSASLEKLNKTLDNTLEKAQVKDLSDYIAVLKQGLLPT